MRATVLFAVMALTAPAGAAVAQAFPSGPVTIVNPYSAGGSSDAFARLQAIHLEAILGVPVLVEAVPGAGGQIAAQQVARSAPDGHILYAGQSGYLSITPSTLKDGEFDPTKALQMVATVRTQPIIVVTRTASPYQTLQDLIDDAKARPGEITYASVGVASMTDMTGLLLMKVAGIELTPVPYQGSAQYSIDLLEGRVDIAMSTPATLAQFPDQLKALGQASPTRSVVAPDVPSAPEVGLPDWVISSWASMMVPAGTPPDVIAKLQDAFRVMNDDPAFTAKMIEMGHEPYFHTAEEFRPQWDSLIATMQPFVAAMR